MAAKLRKRRKESKIKQISLNTKTNSLKSRIIGVFKSERQRKKIIFFSILVSISLWLFWGIPLPTQLSSSNLPVSTKIFDRNGKLIYEIYSDKRRTPVNWSLK